MSTKSLLNIGDISDERLQELVTLAFEFENVLHKPSKLAALNGKLVGIMFFENSTRTRLSFEIAAKKLSADVINFSSQSSSMNKGESIKDTVITLENLGVDIIVFRHSNEGIGEQIDKWGRFAVINAGDGCHQHPTQALGDLVTLLQAYNAEADQLMEVFKNKKILILGDVVHSRVARSVSQLFSRLGAEVVIVGPPSFMPYDLSLWAVKRVSFDLQAELKDADVLYLLRIQRERFEQGCDVSLPEYKNQYSVGENRLKGIENNFFIMHPGPVNKGVEIDDSVFSLKRCLINQQVKYSIPTRMATLFLAATKGFS